MSDESAHGDRGTTGFSIVVMALLSGVLVTCGSPEGFNVIRAFGFAVAAFFIGIIAGNGARTVSQNWSPATGAFIGILLWTIFCFYAMSKSGSIDIFRHTREPM